MKPKTILMMTSTFPVTEDDGLPRFVLDFAREVNQSEEYRVIVLTPHIPGAKSREEMDNVEVIRYRYAPEQWESLTGEGGIMTRIRENSWRMFLVAPFLVSMWAHALWIVLKERVKLIHAHWVFPQGLVAWLVGTMTRTRYGVTVHGSDVNSLTGIFPKINGFVLNQAQFVTAGSEQLQHKTKSLTSSEVRVLPLGIDHGYFEVERDQVDPHLILSVGRLDWNKGFQDVIQALPELSGFRYVAVGAGSDQEKLEEIAGDKDVQDRVDFVGAKSPREIQEYMKSAGVFVLPSRAEGFGLVVIEAMAAGVPVVVNGIQILKHHVKQGAGFAVECQDEEELAAAIRAAAKDQVSVSKARKYAEQFSWDKTGEAVIALYKEIGV